MTRKRWFGADTADSASNHLNGTRRGGAGRPRRVLSGLLAGALGLSMLSVAPGTAVAAPVEAAQVQAASSAARVEAEAATETGADYKVLVWTGLTGFNHTAGIAAGSAAIQAWGAEYGYTVDVSDNSAVFTDANLAQYSTVVFLSTTGNDKLNASQKAAFERYIQGGGGYFGIHAATDSNTNWPWYGQLIGGAYFKQHPAIQSARLFIEDKVHPSTAGLADTLTITDEWYDFTLNPRNKVHVLASIDTKSYSGETMGYDHPMAWCHDFDGGRSAYNALGHDATNWSSAWFKQMIVGGIQTTAGVVPSDCGATIPGNYEVVALDDNTIDPMMLDIAADGSVFYIQITGALRVIDPVTNQTATVATLPVNTANEGGMLGLALDPDFATNNWIYLFHSPTGSLEVDRLSRFTYDPATKTLVAGSEKVVLDVPVQRGECCHHGGSLVFNKTTGDLYLATGDNTNPFASSGFAPVDYRTGRASWDASRTSGNTNSLSGKVLRIHPEDDGTYTIPSGNLFPVGSSDPAKTKPEIFAMGMRNPFRINIDPDTGTLFVADYGPDTGSASDRGPQNTVEWNIVDEPGFYGWPFCTGPNNAYKRWNFANNTAGTAYECATGVINDSPNNTGLTQLPPAVPADIWYHYNANTTWPTHTGGAPMAGAVYSYDADLNSDRKWPAYWDGKPLLAEWNNNTLYSVLTTSDMKTALRTTQLRLHKLPDPATREMKMMDSKFGPDGALYFIDWGSGWDKNNDSGIYRIDYVYGNRAPIAKSEATVTAGAAPLAVQFSSAGSIDPDGESLTYLWDFGDGTTSTEANPSHTFAAGVYSVQLTVTDAGGKTAVSNIEVVSGNNRPVVTITGPKDGQFFEFGDQISFSAVVTDVEDGTTEDGSISCTLVNANSLLGHVSGGSAHAHPMQEATGCSGVIQTLEDGGHGGDVNLFWIIQVSYTDKGNGAIPALTGTESVILKSKRLQAEHFDSTGRISTSTATGDPGVTTETTSDTAGGTENIGYIEPGDWFAFDRVNLTDIDAISMRNAGTAGAGFQIRWNDPENGPILGTVPGKATSGWQAFDNSSVTLTDAPTETGTIYFVALGSDTGPVVNVNWIDFIGKGATINQRPTINSASVTPLTGIAPLNVELSAAAVDPEGDAVSYSWDMGTTDGDVVTGATGNYTYTVPGKYTVTLDVTDAGGAVAHRTFEVNVIAPQTECFGNLSDEFNGTMLDDNRWSVVRGDQTLQVTGGNLRIPATQTDLYGAGGNVPNIVLQDLPSGSWQVTTKVTAQAYTQYQQAGLIIYKDDENYAKWVIQGRHASDKAQRVIQFAHEVGGSAQEANSPNLGADFPDTVHLRLTSDGTTITPSYSVNGTDWIEPTASWSGWTNIRKTTATLGTDLKVGLTAFTNTVGTPINADFDYFHITPDASAGSDTPNDEFNGSSLAPCRWEILRPDPSKLRLAGGWLELDTVQGEVDVTPNMLVQRQPAGNNWTIETRIDGSAFNGGYSQVGLIAWADAQNFVKMDLVRDSATGRRIELRTNIDGAFGQPQPQANVSTDILYLRLERQDNAFKGSYSTNGTTWTDLSQTVQNIPVASDGKVGVYAAGVNTTTTQVAKVDYFRVLGAPGAPDVTAPVTTATTNPAAPNGTNGWYTSNVGVTLAATDAESGVANISYSVDGGAQATYSGPISVSGEGNHTVTYFATDQAGNAETAKTLSLKIDSVKPITGAELTDGNSVGVALQSVDATSGIARTEYRIDAGEWTTYSGPFTVTRTSAAQSLLFRSVDNAGNTETIRTVTIAALPVVLAPSTTSISLPAASAAGHVATTGLLKVTVTVTGNGGTPTGMVFVHADGEIVGAGTLLSGTAVVNVAGLAAGTRELTASFAGDAAFAGSESAAVSAKVYFPDYTGGQFVTEVAWLADSGITTGNTDGTFAPNAPVTRQAMAAFLFRLSNPGQPDPTCTTAPFNDVPADSTFCGPIAWLKSSGISTGYAGNIFKPGAAVERQAMAAFLYRLAHNGADAPACTVDSPFSDVSKTNTFCGAVTWLASTGVTTGYADGTFGAAKTVDRQAMAAFLYRFSQLG